MVAIRDELPHDIPAREALLDACFGPSRWTKTCERLREGRRPAQGLALAAEREGRLAGTLRLWNVEAGRGRPALMLGPLAVDPAVHGVGLGGALMREALARSAERGHGAVVLVGDAAYYERFGFSAEPTGLLWLPGPFERGRFLGLELVPGALRGALGLVRATGLPADAPAGPPLLERAA